MFMFKMGDRILNLEYLIMAERLTPERGKVRVTVETGVTFDVDGEDADRLSFQLEALASDPMPRPITHVIRRGDPASGPAKQGA